jgi:hypothetical protein
MWSEVLHQLLSFYFFFFTEVTQLLVENFDKYDKYKQYLGTFDSNERHS